MEGRSTQPSIAPTNSILDSSIAGSALPRVGSQSRSIAFGVTAAVVSLLCGAVALRIIMRFQQRFVELDLARNAEVLLGEAARRVDGKLWILKATRAFFIGSERVDAAEFALLGEELRSYDPDIVWLAWAPYDETGQRAIVDSVSPLDHPQQHVLGLDLIANDDCRIRLERAAAENGVAMLAPVDPSRQAEERLVFALPIYSAAGNRFGDSNASHRVFGFVAVALPAAALLATAPGTAGSLLRTRLESAYEPLHASADEPQAARPLAWGDGYYRIICETLSGPNPSLFVPIVIACGFGALVIFVFAAIASSTRRAERRRIELETLVRERTSDLEASNRELDAFSYSVSHDLRAPLRAVNGFAEARVIDHGEPLTNDARALLTRVQENGRRAANLVDDLLRLSHLGKTELPRTRVDTSSLVREIVDRCKSEVQGRSIDWIIDPLPVVGADSRLLAIVFENLVENAIKFSRTKKPAVLHIGHEVDRSGAAIFFVRDNGTGFDSRYSERLFTPFQRLHRADAYEGNGIGLALCSGSSNGTTDRFGRRAQWIRERTSDSRSLPKEPSHDAERAATSAVAGRRSP